MFSDYTPTHMPPVYEAKQLNKAIHASHPSTWGLRLEDQESQVSLGYNKDSKSKNKKINKETDSISSDLGKSEDLYLYEGLLYQFSCPYFTLQITEL